MPMLKERSMDETKKQVKLDGALIISTRPKSSNSKENCEKCNKLIEYTFGKGKFPADVIKIKRLNSKSQKAQRGKSGRAITAFSATAKTEKKEDKCRKLIKQIFGSKNKYSKAKNAKVPVDNSILQSVTQIVSTENNEKSENVGQSRVNTNVIKDTNTNEGSYVTTKTYTSILPHKLHSNMKSFAFDVYIPTLPTVSVLTSDPIQWNISHVNMASPEIERIECPICPVYLNATKSQIYKRHKSTTCQSNNEMNTSQIQPRIDCKLDAIPENKDKIKSKELQSESVGKMHVDILNQTTHIEVPPYFEDEADKKVVNETATVKSYNSSCFETYSSKSEKDKSQWIMNPKSPLAPSKEPTAPNPPQKPEALRSFSQQLESPLRHRESDPFQPDNVIIPKTSHEFDSLASSKIHIKRPQKPSSASSESIKNDKESSENNLEITEMTFTEEVTGLHFISPLKRPKFYDSLPPTKTDLHIIERVAVQFYKKRPSVNNIDHNLNSNQPKNANQDYVSNLSKEDTQMMGSKIEDHITKASTLGRIVSENKPYKEENRNLPLLIEEEDSKSKNLESRSPVNSRQLYFENRTYLKTLMAAKFPTKETLKNKENKVLRMAKEDEFPSKNKNKVLNAIPSPLRITLSNTFKPANKETSSKYNKKWYKIEKHCRSLDVNQTENTVHGDTRFFSSSSILENTKTPRIEVVLKDKAKTRNRYQKISEDYLALAQEKVEANLGSAKEQMKTNFISSIELPSTEEGQKKPREMLKQTENPNILSKQSKKSLLNLELLPGTLSKPKQIQGKSGNLRYKMKKQPKNPKSLGAQPQKSPEKSEILLDTLRRDTQETNILSEQPQQIQVEFENLPERLKQQTEYPKSLSEQPQEIQKKFKKPSEMLSRNIKESKDKSKMLPDFTKKLTEDPKLLSQRFQESQEKLEMISEILSSDPQTKNKKTQEITEMLSNSSKHITERNLSQHFQRSQKIKSDAQQKYQETQGKSEILSNSIKKYELNFLRQQFQESQEKSNAQEKDQETQEKFGMLSDCLKKPMEELKSLIQQSQRSQEKSDTQEQHQDAQEKCEMLSDSLKQHMEELKSLIQQSQVGQKKSDAQEKHQETQEKSVMLSDSLQKHMEESQQKSDAQMLSDSLKQHMEELKSLIQQSQGSQNKSDDQEKHQETQYKSVMLSDSLNKHMEECQQKSDAQMLSDSLKKYMEELESLIQQSQGSQKISVAQEKHQETEVKSVMLSDSLKKHMEESQRKSEAQMLSDLLKTYMQELKSLIQQSQGSQNKSDAQEKHQETQKKPNMLSDSLRKHTEELKSLIQQFQESQEKLDTQEKHQETKDQFEILSNLPKKHTKVPKSLTEKSQESQEKSEILSQILSKETQEKRRERLQKSDKLSSLPLKRKEEPQQSQESQVKFRMLSKMHHHQKKLEKYSRGPRKHTQETKILNVQHQESKERIEKLSEMLRKARLRNRLNYCQSYYTYMMMKQSLVMVCKNCGQIGDRCGCPSGPLKSPSTSSTTLQKFTPCPTPNKVPPCNPRIPPKIPSPPIPPYCKPRKVCPPQVNASINRCRPPRPTCVTKCPRKDTNPCRK